MTFPMNNLSSLPIFIIIYSFPKYIIHVDAVLMGCAGEEHTRRCRTHGLCWLGTYMQMPYSWVVLVRNVHADAVLMGCAG